MKEWYVRHEGEVLGPFPSDEIQKYLKPDSLVCESGSGQWRKARNVASLKPIVKKTNTRSETEGIHLPDSGSSSTTGREEKPIEPTLETLREISERANNDELLEQYEKHWDQYDSKERRVIFREIENRGLLDQAEGRRTPD